MFFFFLMFIIIIIISLKTNFRLMRFTFLAILMSCYIVYITDVVFSKTHRICASKVISKIMGQQSPITSIEVPHALESGCRIYANAWHYDGNDPCPLVISLHWTESSRGWWDSGHAYILAEDNPEQTTFPSHLSWWEHLACQTHKGDRIRLLKGKFISLPSIRSLRHFQNHWLVKGHLLPFYIRN